MLGRQSGVGAPARVDAAHIMVTRCILHRHALATKTLPPKLAEVLKTGVEGVNYVRNSAPRRRIFRELCKETGCESEVLMFSCSVVVPGARVRRRPRLLLRQQMSMLKTSRESLKFSRARFSSSSSEQERSQRFGVNKGKSFQLLRRIIIFFLPFVTTRLCEHSFSRMPDIKTKERNRRCCESDVSGACQGEARRI